MAKKNKSVHFLDKIVNWVDRNPRGTIVVVAVFLILIFFIIPILLTQIGWIVTFDSTTGVIGDTIGGITGPLVGLVGAFLTFLAFWIQYKANQQLKKDNKSTKRDLEKERFENRFFELVRQFKNISDSIRIEAKDKDYIGQSAFDFFWTELKELYSFSLSFINYTKKQFPNVLYFDEKYALQWAYRTAYLGLFSFESIYKEKHHEDIEMVKLLNVRLLNKVDEVRRKKDDDSFSITLPFIGEYESLFKMIWYKGSEFIGCYNTMELYYRNLFHIVKYVDGRKYNYNTQNEYLRVLRAQLSKIEQTLLYYNYATGYGAEWENRENSYLCRFKMIHNAIVGNLYMGVNPEELFELQIAAMEKEGSILFQEWE